MNTNLPQRGVAAHAVCVVSFTVGCLLVVTGMPSSAGHHAAAKTTKTATAAKTAPDVTLPYTFTCPHCGMKITIKTAADWNKSCQTCACGKTNLGCYNDIKK
jgi:hypothetical protein